MLAFIQFDATQRTRGKIDCRRTHTHTQTLENTRSHSHKTINRSTKCADLNQNGKLNPPKADEMCVGLKCDRASRRNVIVQREIQSLPAIFINSKHMRAAQPENSQFYCFKVPKWL